jgi:hypothetical protein
MRADWLQRVVAESFSLPPALTLPAQRILEITLDHIRYLSDSILDSCEGCAVMGLSLNIAQANPSDQNSGGAEL